MRKLFILVGLLCLLSRDAAAQDQVTASFFGAGQDFAITTTVTRVDLHLNGVEVHFSKREGPNRWPDARTPGWDGDLQYSVGLAINVNGQWFASAPIETWFNNNIVGGPIQDSNVTCPQGFRGQIACNWFYDGRWGALAGQQPAPGQQIGVFVVAGDPRNNFTPVHERSNIVLVTMPPAGVATSFTFNAPPPVVVPQPPPPVVPPAPLPSNELSALSGRLDQCIALIQLTNQNVTEGRNENRSFFEAVKAEWKNAVKYAAPIIGALFAGKAL